MGSITYTVSVFTGRRKIPQQLFLGIKLNTAASVKVGVRASRKIKSNSQSSRTVLSNMVASAHLWLFKVNLNKIKIQLLSHGTTFPVLSSPTWLGATVLNGTE